MKRFILVGAAGYIAERHMRAIKETGNDLVCAFDKSDVMGRIDLYFPDAEFFTTISELEAWIVKNPVDYMVICVPNDLHLFFTKLALHYNINVICEKPLTLSSGNLDEMKIAEQNSKATVNSILQLRYHPAIIKLKESVSTNHKIKLTYVTPRGKWYHKSWKGNINRSGGILMNIGVHFFDMLLWIFGDLKHSETYKHEKDKAVGKLFLENAEVEWLLSIDSKDLPNGITSRTFRSIEVDEEEIEFTNGFTNLHTISYERILNGEGYGIEDVQGSINLIESIR